MRGLACRPLSTARAHPPDPLARLFILHPPARPPPPPPNPLPAHPPRSTTHPPTHHVKLLQGRKVGQQQVIITFHPEVKGVVSTDAQPGQPVGCGECPGQLTENIVPQIQAFQTCNCEWDTIGG